MAVAGLWQRLPMHCFMQDFGGVRFSRLGVYKYLLHAFKPVRVEAVAVAAARCHFDSTPGVRPAH